MSRSYGTVNFGQEKIGFKLLFVDRKTMEIAIYPDKTVIVKAPVGTDYSVVEKRVLRRAGWIKRQLSFFEQFDPRTPKRNFVGGETHLYLGHHHRIKIHRGKLNEVKLVRGFFQINVNGDNSSEHVKRLLNEWYAQKALLRFQESFDRCWAWFKKLSLEEPRIQIRRMKKRWGSLSKNGLLTLNTDLVRAPKECIDYVITHELCHLRYHDHGPNFYRLLDKAMPDWGKRKAKLEQKLA